MHPVDVENSNISSGESPSDPSSSGYRVRPLFGVILDHRKA